jgi:uncharacterized protein YgiM (DUF1202 family)
VLWTAQPVRADAGPSIQPVAAPVATTGRGTVKGDRCNVRSRPSTSAEVVAQLHKGDAVEVLERKSSEHGKPAEWLRIALPASAKCYVNAKLLADGVANAENLNVRCGPGGNYRDIGKLPKGTKVDVVETKGEWTQIKPTPQCSGWIAGELVDIEPAVTPSAATPPPTTSINTPEVATPPVAAPMAPAAPSVSIVNIDPDVAVAYVVKDGYLQAVTEPNAPAAYELRTREVDRLSFRMAYLESPETNLKKYEGKHVRINGNQRWRKGERYPVIAIERIDIVL